MKKSKKSKANETCVADTSLASKKLVAVMSESGTKSKSSSKASSDQNAVYAYPVGHVREDVQGGKTVQITTVSVHAGFAVEQFLYFDWDKKPTYENVMVRVHPYADDLVRFLRNHSDIRTIHQHPIVVARGEFCHELTSYELIISEGDLKLPPMINEFILMLQEQFREDREAYQRLSAVGTIQFDLLDQHFKIGGHVVFGGTGESELEGGRITEVEYGYSYYGPFFAIHITRYTSNGKYFAKLINETKIYGFRGKARLVELDCRIATSDELVMLSNRGKHWQSIVHQPTYMNYDGKIEIKAGWTNVYQTANGRCMLDHVMYNQMVTSFDRDEDRMDIDEYMTEIPSEFLFTTPGYMRGYSLSKKRWGKFSLSRLSEIAFRNDAYDLLVLDAETKAEVRALVEQSDDMFTDIITGKGGGAIFLLHGNPGTGKAQPLNSMVKTPTGEIRMGDISIGDSVIGDDGHSHAVLGVYPQGIRPVYEFTFDDGRVVRADEDHLWRIKRKGTSRTRPETQWDIQSTKRIVAQMGSNRTPHYVPLCQSVEYPAIDIGMDPWLLGFLIGDGFMKDKHLSFSTADQEIIDRVTSLMPPGYDVFKIPDAKYDYRIRMTDRVGNSTHEIKDVLKQYGLYGMGSGNKFIPHVCFTMATDQRLELIRGLMDSDGFVSKQKCVQYTTISEQLILGFQQLIWSIGGICKITSRTPTYTNTNGEQSNGQLAYTATIRHPNPDNLVWLPRKKTRLVGHHQYSDGLALRIVSIKQLADEPTQCILVDSASHLYLTDNFVVTHNTLTAESVAEILHRPLYSISVGELGITPGEVEETLQKVLEMVTAWNAVLLLDEADIFLETRSKDDIVRNAMVGVFLRLLEYHNGVLFLTTNRVANFDPAVLSRISVILKYPDFTDEIRATVWRNILSAAGLSHTGIDLPYLAKAYPVNGRQIKNAIRISLSLAADRKEPVTQKLIEGRIARMVSITAELTGPVEAAPVPAQKPLVLRK